MWIHRYVSCISSAMVYLKIDGNHLTWWISFSSIPCGNDASLWGKNLQFHSRRNFLSLLLQSIVMEFCRCCACALTLHAAVGWWRGAGGGGNGFELSGRKAAAAAVAVAMRHDSFSSLAETRTNESVVTVSGMDSGLTTPYTLSTTYFNDRHTDAAVIIVGFQ